MMKLSHAVVLATAIAGIGASLWTDASSLSTATGRPTGPVNFQQEQSMNMAISETLPAHELTRLEARLPIPDHLTLAASQAVRMGDEAVWHLRYERADGRNRGLHGEHFSVVVSRDDHRLKGITRMVAALAEGELPGAAEARQAAERFLENRAPDLLANMDVQWIKPHAEEIRVRGENGGTRTVPVTGMKVKCYNPGAGNYFWVIVGPGEEVITFERDIVWSTLMGRRETEQWLHDRWLARQQVSAG